MDYVGAVIDEIALEGLDGKVKLLLHVVCVFSRLCSLLAWDSSQSPIESTKTRKFRVRSAVRIIQMKLTKFAVVIALLKYTYGTVIPVVDLHIS